MKFILPIFLFLNYFLKFKALPQIKLPQGIVEGKLIVSESGEKYFGFFGIPYALPPTGPLRFKPPVPYLGWSGIFDASRYGNACPQKDATGQLIGSEDCLNLNVFTKSFQPNNHLLPVMVYIHAESYENGDSSLYGSEKLMDQNIVLVTFNYRLGVLGFLSTDDQNAIGNFGLYDQILALKWIQENIMFFGGNPKEVTLFGQGAGASSIMFHLMSDISSNLFHKAILQSGSNLCNWAIERKPLEFVKKIAEKVGCLATVKMDLNSGPYNQQSRQYPNSIQDKMREILPIKGIFRDRRTINRMDTDINQDDNQLFNSKSITNKEIVECLRHTSLNKILNAQSQDKIFGEYPQRAAATINKDGLIKEEPFETLKKNKFIKKPLIIGLNKDETAYFIPLLIGDNKPTLTYEYLEKNVIPRFVEATISFQNKSKVKIVSEIMLQYFSNVDWNNLTQILQQFISMTSDGAYGNCIDATAKLYSRSNGLVYFYSYEYRSTNSMLDLLVNLQNEVNIQSKQNINRISNPWLDFDKSQIVCHGDQLFSLFSLKTGSLMPYSDQDLYAQKRLITLWTEFASTKFNESSVYQMNQPPYYYSPFDYHHHNNYLNSRLNNHLNKQINLDDRKVNLFLGPNSVWPQFKEDDGQYLVIGNDIKIQSNYRKRELDFWKLLFDSELLLTMEKSTEQLDYSNLSSQKYVAFAYTMLITAIFLMIIIGFLLIILWYFTKRTRKFKTSIPGICSTNISTMY